MRPQLLDRFGLHVEVKTEGDLDRRMEIVERREAFESNPELFCASVDEVQQQLRSRITRAQRNANRAKVDRGLLRQIAQLCTDLKIDGHRGEITIARAGRGLAAFEGRRNVTEEDVRRVAVMSLRHRLRRDPLEETAGTERIQRALEKVFADQPKKRNAGSGSGGQGDGAPHHPAARNQAAGRRRGHRIRDAGARAERQPISFALPAVRIGRRERCITDRRGPPWPRR